MDRLLKTALATEKQQDKSIRAISYLLGQIALTVSAVLGPDEQKTWRNDPWLYQAFLHGASHLLARLGPEGELVPPTSWLDPTVPAENLGAIAETHVWSLLLSAERPSSAGFDVPQGYWLYAMPQARDDLGIKSKNNKLIAELLQKGDKS